ncbi:MAG: GAF domain-containing sensor histidine kinase, partial [Myxococcota bacterium]|nr:GAF domain-containing sensor histidine kinase [Myxococcota bacterium]
MSDVSSRDADKGLRFESRHRAVVELAALDKSDFDAVLRRILRTDASELDVERVNCWALDSDRAIRCVAGYLRGPDRFESGTVLEAATYPSYFRALADNPIILAGDARTDDRTREFTESYLVPLGITSMMDVPIWVRGQLWGVVCHEHVGPARQWSDAERDFAVTIGHIVSMAVEARERADAEQTARFSEFFMGVLSHDLRNPLGSIRTAAELLLQRDTDETRLRATERIVRNTDRMSRMIDQLLDFTRIRSGGGLPTHLEPVDLAMLAHQVVSELSTDVASRVDIEHRGNALGMFDADRMWQTISNLLINAVAHGSPAARVQVLVDGTSADRVIIEITNAGSMPGSLVPVLFDPFRRHDAAATPRKKGLGLGLFIVREIVTAHAGTIAVKPEVDRVTFRVTL